MLTYIKNLFKRDEDPNLTALKKHFKGSYKNFNDDEQAVLLLRLSGASQDKVAVALDMSLTRLNAVETGLIAKLKADK